MTCEIIDGDKRAKLFQITCDRPREMALVEVPAATRRELRQCGGERGLTQDIAFGERTPVLADAPATSTVVRPWTAASSR